MQSSAAGRRLGPILRPSAAAGLLLTLVGGCAWMARSPARESGVNRKTAAVKGPAAEAHVDVRRVIRPLTAAEAADYVGDAACAKCHKEEARLHRTSGHSRTLRRVTASEYGPLFNKSATIVDDRRSYYYRVRLANDECLMDYSDGRAYGALKADYAIGSGKRGVTFFSEYKPDRYLKLRLSYYPTIHGWYFTPDEFPPHQITGPAGLVHDPKTLNDCLLCHVTVLRESGGTLDLANTLFGVGCERCHGPGRDHIRMIRATGHDSGIERLGRAAPARLTQLCGVCHRSSENASITEQATVADLARLQGIALEQSACYKKSGRLSCSSCHDPHGNARAGTASYDRVCMSCHQPKQPAGVCRVNTATGCTSCHMPLQDVGSIPFVKVRHHWIRVWDRTAPEARPATRAADPSGENRLAGSSPLP